MTHRAAASGASGGAFASSAAVERLIAALAAETGAAAELVVHGEVVVRINGPGGARPAAGSATTELLVPGLTRSPLGRIRLSREALSDVEARVASALVRIIGEELAAQALIDAERRRTERTVRRLLDGGHVPMAVQPIVDLTGGGLRGVEALARFRDRRRSPQQHFSDAAAVGLSVELELLALTSALPALEVLPAAAYLSVNVSPTTLSHPSLAERLRGVDLSRLVLEVTEHAEVADYDALAGALEPLRNRGLRIAVDDAGAGFASMRHVLKLSPDIIKLDVSLIRDIDTDRMQRALSYSLSAFAAAIDAQLVAEGVETSAERGALSFLGIQSAQGYFLGRPVPLESMARRLNLTTSG